MKCSVKILLTIMRDCIHRYHCDYVGIRRSCVCTYVRVGSKGFLGTASNYRQNQTFTKVCLDHGAMINESCTLIPPFHEIMEFVQWLEPGEPRFKKARMIKSKLKCLLITFFDVKGLVHYEFLPEGQTINRHYYIDVLRRLREALRQKRPEKWHQKNWFLHHDNARPHTAVTVQLYLAKHGIALLPQPPYSPVLAPGDFFLYPKSKKVLKGRRFDLIAELKKNTWNILKSLKDEDFQRKHPDLEGIHISIRKCVWKKKENSKLKEEKKLKTRAQLKGESTEFYIQDVLCLCKEVDPQMSEEDKTSNLMKGIAEELYQALLPRDLIRKIVRNEIQKALDSPQEEPEIAAIEDLSPENKMAFPVYDGTCLEWMGWWSRFEMIHESAVLSEVEKFQYLVQSMKLVKALQDRFGDEVILTEVYVRQLLKLVINNVRRKNLSLEGMYDQLESHLRSLESLGVTVRQNACFLYPMVESSLPEDLLRIWQRSALAGYGGDELELPITIDQRLERLLEFLRREVKGDQRLEYMKEGFGESSQRRNYGQHIARMHAAQITEAQGRVTPLCLRCKGKHWIQDCAGWRSMTVTKRMDEIRKVNACFRCLREPRISPGEQEIALSGMHVRTAIPTALLATARVRLVGPRGVGVTVRALLDQGFQSSFVHRDLLHHLTIPVHKVNAQIFGINDTRGEHVKQMVSCSVASLTESGWTIPIRGLVVERMTGILPSRDLRIPVPSSWKTLPLADPQFETSGRVDVILGTDVYGNLLLPEVKYDEKTQLCAQNTRLGWIVSGKLPGEGEVGPHRVYNIRVNYEENLDNVLRRFWEVEEVPFRHAKSDADEFCEELYKTRGMAKMERHEKRSRTPASRTGEKISEYSMSKEEYPTGRVKLTESKDGYGSERVKGKVDKLCPASAMVRVTERKTCPDSSVLKRPEESTCPDCSKVKGSMCPHCANMKEIEMLTCTDSAKVKAELCPDSSKPKDYDRLEEKGSDRRILSIDELAEELLESYKEFPPIHVKVNKCGNLDEHWLRRKIREDLCQVPPKIPPYIRMSDSTKLKVEKLRKMACFLKSTKVLGDLQTNVVNLDIVE
ncbi:hypothetical protein LAZ67_15000787 [Cordylochernes scorpioides]|uniref:Uncharacterized protein n=1 Tax=Cordylochernes scorpioides TaxID=51811 RepID=A0ABY6L8L3_9ARAC|nr:hypothetical protein LAZ67_15000787 [Cordylochernes scorpioides]